MNILTQSSMKNIFFLFFWFIKTYCALQNGENGILEARHILDLKSKKSLRIIILVAFIR